MAVLALVGAGWAGLYGGSKWLIGFVAGAIFSVLNFWFWHRLVRRLGEVSGDGSEPHRASTMFFGMRYFLFMGAAYAILQYFEASLSAALVGIFVAVAAVLLEILFELLYGT